MELITKIMTIIAGRELVCDCCNSTLAEKGVNETEKTFYATLWKNGKTYYIEKFICENCKENYFNDVKEVEADQIPVEVRNALLEAVLRDFYGYITPLSGDEFIILLFPDFLEFLRERKTN